ncbi:MAG: type II toxin-antitoxin system RelE/ParE family toxin [Leptospirales bacterium]
MPRMEEVGLFEYKIFETDTFISNIDNIQADLRNKMYEKLLNYVYPQMKQNPFYGPNIKKLKNYEPPTWRYRIGNYRLFYEIDKADKVISITSFEIRDKAY